MPPKKKKPRQEPEAVAVRTSVSRRKDCPDCGSRNITFDAETEQLICQDCGSMFDELPPDLRQKPDEIEFL